MNVVIYGLFDGARCIYVGKTRNLERRIQEHKPWIRFLKKPVVATVLHKTTPERAAACERRTIRKFRKLGQADYNWLCCQPKKEREKVSLNLSISTEVVRAIKDLVKANRPRMVSASAFTERLLISFLRKEGVELQTMFNNGVKL